MTEREAPEPNFEWQRSCDRAFDAAFAPDGKSFATIGERTVVLWEVDRKERIAHTRLTHSSSLDFTPSGSHLVVKNTSGEVTLLDGRTMETLPVSTRTFGEGPRHAAVDDETVLDVNWGGHAISRSLSDGSIEVIKRLEGWSAASFTRSPDRKRIALLAERRTGKKPEGVVFTKQWPTTNDSWQRFGFAWTSFSPKIAIANDGTVVGVNLDKLTIHDPGGERVGEREVSNFAHSIAWRPGADEFVLSTSDAVFCMTRELDVRWKLAHDDCQGLSFSEDGTMLFVAGGSSLLAKLAD